MEFFYIVGVWEVAVDDTRGMEESVAVLYVSEMLP